MPGQHKTVGKQKGTEEGKGKPGTKKKTRFYRCWKNRGKETPAGLGGKYTLNAEDVPPRQES